MLKKKSQISDAAVAVLAALILVSLAACGGPAVSPTDPGTVGGPEPEVILSQTLDNVEPGGQRVVSINVPFTRTLEVTVLWTDPTNSVTAALIGVGCPSFREAAADCQERRTSRGGREFREGVITYPRAGGAYHLLVENDGPGVETIRVRAALTSQPAPVQPTPYPTNYPNYPPH